MTRPRWAVHVAAWILGCAGAIAGWTAMRTFLSPWRAIDESRLVMLASDSCMTSRWAVQSVIADPRLKEFIVPVPADGPEHAAPIVCAAAREILGEEDLRARWLPEELACRWLREDAFAAISERALPTPSWYSKGRVVEGASGEAELELFRERGWRIDWTTEGMRLSPLDGPSSPVPVREIERIEDLGMSAFRDERW